MARQPGTIKKIVREELDTDPDFIEFVNKTLEGRVKLVDEEYAKGQPQQEYIEGNIAYKISSARHHLASAYYRMMGYAQKIGVPKDNPLLIDANKDFFMSIECPWDDIKHEGEAIYKLGKAIEDHLNKK